MNSDYMAASAFSSQYLFNCLAHLDNNYVYMVVQKTTPFHYYNSFIYCKTIVTILADTLLLTLQLYDVL